ncbi:Signal transduction histidine kinase [Lutibacter agarilyticus]|uniref:histidine kinase n=1 Tax=Lutibacter agarilyticus TaxID=1109740 RepID=A0A238Y5E0_9FLAO|nr:two-component regulator propeller domain-containing protein [Lutibacter agarilyticus]SNR66192.1 Signal transduction histidine kinase [Lutibacter agarilyticus]
MKNISHVTMNKLQPLFTLLLFTIFFQNIGYGQTQNIIFREMSPPGGFTRYAIQSIIQDDLGYIWMGTQQGLIRYDSKNTDWFEPISNDSLSLPSEEILQIYSDKNNQIWVTTSKGLCKFKRETQNFEPIKYVYEDGSKGSEKVLSILQIKDGRYLVIDNNSFGILDYKNKQLNRIAKNQLKYPEVLYKDDLNRIWITTRNGDIYRFSPSSNTLKKIISTNVKALCIYSENDQIWIGTEENGAKIYNLKGDFIKQVVFKSTSELSKSERVRTIKRDTYGRLWFGTDDGLFMDYEGSFTWLDPDDYPGIPHNSIFQIYEDNKGQLWIGTWSGGLALLHHSDNNFKTYRHSPSHNSISNNVVSSILQTNKDELLIGTEVGGLNSFNLITEKFDVIPLDKKQQIKNIKSLCKDKYGGIWAGTFRKGLWYKPAGASSFKVFDYGIDDGNHISSTSVYSLCAVDSGVWIGTYHGGIDFYSFKTKSITRCFLNNSKGIPMNNIEVQSILADNKSNLWIGTYDNFLYRIHLPTEEITKISDNQIVKKNEANTIYSLWQHSSGDIWIGTKNKGLLIYNPDSNKIEYFDDGGFLKQKNVYGIIEDSNKNIWISSNNGLILYNPEDKSKRHFVYSDGIQSNIFSPQAIFKDQDGILNFGGTNGFTRINPKDIKVNSKKPYTIINTLNIKNNKSIYPIYSNNFEIKPIHLNPGETTFRINFFADNYLKPKKNKYKYRLINYYNEWISIENEGSVLYTGLNPGKYIFEVKASNNDGIWNDSPTKMTIIIKQYWYKTNYAYILYILIFVTILYFIGRFYIERVKLKRVILLEKTQRENEEQIHEMKLKFFTNVSHEFRTPLTLISWPLKQLLKSKNISTVDRTNLEIAKRNTNRLLELINQIIDLRKIEKGENKLNISNLDVVELIKDIKQGFLGEIRSKQIDFLIDSNYTKIEIEADQQKLDTILYNLLSNAFKYVQINGQIKISINKKLNTISNSYNNQLRYGQIHTDDFIQITIEDNGTGIDNDDLIKIFNRFEQGRQNNKKDTTKNEGSGIGLSVCKDFTLLHHGEIMVQSSFGKGSRFSLLLPTKQKAQKILFESHQKVKNLNENELPSVQLKNEKSPENRSQILVVEDNPDFSSLICTFLSDYYQVEYAKNGSEGLAVLKQRNIDIIVSDIMMPEMDGFEFCNIVKSQIESSHIPVILLTALSSSENVMVGLDKGADAYIMKPFDENILLKQIENLLEQRRRIHENFTKQFISKKTIDAGGLDNFFLNRVRTVVENNLSNENFSLEKLTDEIMISRSNLHRKIKSLSGLSTSDFVNLVRIKYAVKLIIEENYRFSEVTYKVGFSSQSYFTRCFKKVYNVSPKEYFENLKTNETPRD